MDNETKVTIRGLEIQNEAKAKELVSAYARISDLESEISNLTGTDETYVTPEDQIAFITKIADSSSKFAKEAQDILASIESQQNA